MKKKKMIDRHLPASKRRTYSWMVAAIVVCLALAACSKKKVEEEPNVFYTCSMDPQVMEKKPGKCPICKMELTRTVVSPEQDKQGVRLSETQILLGNIVTQSVQHRSLGEGIHLRGRMVADERNVTLISSRVSGRIERLYFKNPGEVIKAGDRIYDIYSEELQAAIQQYLLLKEKAQLLKGGQIHYQEMLQAARDKLIVWGMSEQQLRSLDKKNYSGTIPFYSQADGVVNAIPVTEGTYVNEGSTVLELAGYSMLWVEAEVYPADRSALKEGTKVLVRPEAFPGEVIEGKISFENPQLEPSSRFSLVRIEIRNEEGKYRPGMRVTATALLKETHTLAVPETAVLYQPETNTVWAQQDNGLFVPKMVETGTVSEGLVEIRSGLEEGERIVISGAYLIDSEYQLRSGVPVMDHSAHTGTQESGTHQH